MKKIKIIVPALALVIIIGVLATVFIGKSGDGNSIGGNAENNNGTLTSSVTLKEYLDGGTRVFIIDSRTVDKANCPNGMCLFEDGQTYFIVNQQLTWGEISKMTDEELIEYARNNVKYTSEYQLHIYTDSTGNNLKYEEIEFSENDNSGFTFLPNTYTATVYDSVFKGFIYYQNSPVAMYYRVSDNLTVTLDNIGDKGVEVD